jgi:phage terminase large subunit-like protein
MTDYFSPIVIQPEFPSRHHAARTAAVTCHRPQGDKVMRLHAQPAMIENGFVHLPQAAPLA